MNRHICHSIIDLDLYNKFKQKKQFFYLKDIKNTLKHNNLDYSGKKKILQERLFNFFENLNNYNKNIDKIIFLQNKIRNNIQQKKIKRQGPGIINKNACVNHEDFYSFENINDLDEVYFFSYLENNNIYFFDIRSFKKILDNDKLNPYTRTKISDSVIKSFNERYEYLKDKKVVLEFENDIIIPLTNEQLLNQKIVNIFQKLDQLNIYAGGLNIDWFSKLSLHQLKLYYKSLEDIWNYRAELTNNQKYEIVPDNNLFLKSVHDIFMMYNKFDLQNLILDEINKLVSSSNNVNSRITGGYYVLTALTEVSLECAETMPWLIQYT